MNEQSKHCDILCCSLYNNRNNSEMEKQTGQIRRDWIIVKKFKEREFCCGIVTPYMKAHVRRMTKALLLGKLKGAQCSETVKSRVPSIWFVWKKYDFLIAREQKLGARGHWALLEHSPGIYCKISKLTSSPAFPSKCGFTVTSWALSSSKPSPIWSSPSSLSLPNPSHELALDPEIWNNPQLLFRSTDTSKQLVEIKFYLLDKIFWRKLVARVDIWWRRHTFSLL